MPTDGMLTEGSDCNWIPFVLLNMFTRHPDQETEPRTKDLVRTSILVGLCKCAEFTDFNLTFAIYFTLLMQVHGTRLGAHQKIRERLSEDNLSSDSSLSLSNGSSDGRCIQRSGM